MLPRELERSIPREVELSPGGRAAAVACALLFAAGIALAGLALANSDDVPVLAAPAALAGCWALALALLAAIRRQMALLSMGRPALGRVTAIRKIRHQHGHSHEATVEFGLLDGARRTAKFSRDKPLAEGGEVVVLYDPDHISRRAIFPLSLVRAKRN